MKLQRPRGVRDFLPEDKILRNEVIKVLEETFTLYGFSPFDTSVIERFETLSSKYAGGAEILKETFTLKDQGKRNLGLRYDLTVPFARVISMNPQLKMPLKRYQIGEVFRDGPIKLGRYRSFVQCDVDVVGLKSVLADAELLQLGIDVFTKLGVSFVIKLNNRKVLNAIMDYAGIQASKHETAILTIDKLEKIPLQDIKKELASKGIGKANADKLIDVVSIKGSNTEKIAKLRKLLKDQEGLDEIEMIVKFVPDATFDISLARGLSYYTGPVFEFFFKKSEIKSSIAGGGRYDNMIKKFVGTGEYPTTGISFGLDVICDGLKKAKETKKTVIQVFIIPLGTLEKSWKLAAKLRKQGIRVSLDVANKGISKNLKYANALNIPYVLIIGEDELKQKKVKLKDMRSGKEQLIKIEEIKKKIKV